MCNSYEELFIHLILSSNQGMQVHYNFFHEKWMLSIILLLSELNKD